MPEDKRNSAVNGGLFTDVPAFVQGLAFAELPADVVAQARRCLLDLIGVSARLAPYSLAAPEIRPGGHQMAGAARPEPPSALALTSRTSVFNL